MSNRARHIPELPTKTSIGANDYLIVESVVGSNSVTSKVTGTNAFKSVVSGPFEDDEEAEDGGVAIGTLYYTSNGSVKVRLV
jgi:hypothetical protein